MNTEWHGVVGSRTLNTLAMRAPLLSFGLPFNPQEGTEPPRDLRTRALSAEAVMQEMHR